MNYVLKLALDQHGSTLEVNMDASIDPAEVLSSYQEWALRLVNVREGLEDESGEIVPEPIESPLQVETAAVDPVAPPPVPAAKARGGKRVPYQEFVFFNDPEFDYTGSSGG